MYKHLCSMKYPEWYLRETSKVFKITKDQIIYSCRVLAQSKSIQNVYQILFEKTSAFGECRTRKALLYSPPSDLPYVSLHFFINNHNLSMSNWDLISSEIRKWLIRLQLFIPFEFLIFSQGLNIWDGLGLLFEKKIFIWGTNSYYDEPFYVLYLKNIHFKYNLLIIDYNRH